VDLVEVVLTKLTLIVAGISIVVSFVECLTFLMLDEMLLSKLRYDYLLIAL
jgi:hypothetical protein